MFPPKMCPGCHCHNEAEVVTPDHDRDGTSNPDRSEAWPCCDAFDDIRAPCSYAVYFQCTNPWPFRTSAPNCLGNGGLYGLPCCFGFSSPSDIEDMVMNWQVHELRKECLKGCVWSDIWEYINPPGYTNEGCDTLEKWMLPCDVNAFGYGSRPDYTFPLMYDSSNGLNPTKWCHQYNPGFSRSLTDCLRPLTNPLFEFRMWTLDASAGTLTWAFTGVPGFGDIATLLASRGISRPIYTADDAWKPWGSNSMTLTNLYEWPFLPPVVCVRPSQFPEMDENQCDDHASRCACCDPGGDSAIFGVTFDGCGQFNGCRTVVVGRVCNPASLPAGVTWPADAKCCVWPYQVDGGTGCTNAGGNWSGSIYVVTYCDGNTYKGDVYCYDSTLAIWVFQGQMSVNEFRCLEGCETFMCSGEEVTLCCTWVISATLPDLDCCCPDDVDVCCCDVPVPSTLTWDDGTNSGPLIWNGSAWVGTGDVAGCTGVDISLQCIDTGFACVWAISFPGSPIVSPGSVVETSCEPLTVTFPTVTGCGGGIYTITIT